MIEKVLSWILPKLQTLLSSNDNIRHLPETRQPPAWQCLLQSAIREEENLNWQVQGNTCVYLI